MSNFWQDRRIFVTGASGLVGSWLVESLIGLKAEVITLIRDWVPNSRFFNEGISHKTIIVKGDLSDSKLIERILAEYEIQSVFHLAAQTIVPIANRNPLSTFESNIAGTWNLLEACKYVKSINSIIVASSDKAYGDALKLPYEETMPLSAIYPYDVSKACADMISVSYAKTFSLPVAITRCGNFFGGGDLNWNRIIPGTIRSIFRNERPIIRSDGKLIRDYIYVEDAVSAYQMLSENLTKNPSLIGEAFNFSNESQYNVLDMTNVILKLMNSTLLPIIKNETSGEIRAQYLNSAKAKNLLDWQPAYSIHTGLDKTIKWYLNFLKEKS